MFSGTDHHHKVEKFSPSVLDLSVNVLEGRRSISGNKSSSQSRNSFSFRYRPLHQFVWRTHIDQQQWIIIAKYKQCLFRLLTCPSIYLKDAHPSAATDHHRKVETLPLSVLDLSINFLKGHTSISSNSLSSESTNSVSFASRSIHAFPWRISV